MVEKMEFGMGPVDCMACLVALTRGYTSDATHKGADKITHATCRHDSYGKYQALICTYRRDGKLQLVPRE